MIECTPSLTILLCESLSENRRRSHQPHTENHCETPEGFKRRPVSNQSRGLLFVYRLESRLAKKQCTGTSSVHGLAGAQYSKAIVDEKVDL